VEDKSMVSFHVDPPSEKIRIVGQADCSEDSGGRIAFHFTSLLESSYYRKTIVSG
jgi:hypothetical protein